MLIVVSGGLFLGYFYSYTNKAARDRVTQNFLSLEIGMCIPGAFLTVWLIMALWKVKSVQSDMHVLKKSTIFALATCFGSINLSCWLALILCNDEKF